MLGLRMAVPSLESCRSLGSDDFKDSALVWVVNPMTGFECIAPRSREYPAFIEKCPAPTAQELMDALVSMGTVWNASVRHLGYGGYAARCRMVVTGSRGQKLPGEWRQAIGSTMANALLELWIDVNREV